MCLLLVGLIARTQSVSRASVLSDAVDMAGGAKVLRGPVTL